MSYNTKQKDLILNIIEKQEHEFTVKDIYNEVHDNVGLTTIYRLVDKLVDENLLIRFIDKDNNTYYQYLKKCEEVNHFYLKCVKCKKLEHIDCDCISDLWTHISKEHKFKPNKDNIIINGTCKKCLEKEIKVC